MKTKRLLLSISPEADRLLDEMASKTNSTRSNVLRIAITLMSVAVEAKESGKRLVIVDGEGKTSQIVGF